MNIQDALQVVRRKEPLFASLLTNLRVIQSDDCPTCGTDGNNLYYNQDFIDTLTLDELCGVILHEVFHCIYNHLWRCGKRNKTKFNIAADYAVNTLVIDTFPLPQGALLETRYAGMTAEQIYDLLPDPPKHKNKKSQEQQWGEHDYWNGKKPKSLLDKLKKAVRNDDALEKQRAEQKWQDIKHKLIKDFGTLPNNMQRVIKNEYYVPVVDWATLVSTILSEDTTDYTFSPPDRRFLEADFVLPDLYTLDKVKDVVFAYDTSASISREQLTAFYNETKNIMENFTSLQGWAAVCDCWLHHFSELDPNLGMESINFSGGGGTSFIPVFNEIKRLELQPRAVFYFTDTEGSFPYEDPGFPVFWLVPAAISEYDYQLHVPFGKVVKFLLKSN